jgi:hypothetical protein
MPLLLMKQVEKNLLNLNPNAHSVYIEGDRGAGTPYTRWGRTFDRAHPMTLWADIGKDSLGHPTFRRDQDVLSQELARIQRVLSMGAVVLFPAEEYADAIASLRDTSPPLAEYVMNYVDIWQNL